VAAAWSAPGQDDRLRVAPAGCRPLSPKPAPPNLLWLNPFPPMRRLPSGMPPPSRLRQRSGRLAHKKVLINLKMEEHHSGERGLFRLLACARHKEGWQASARGAPSLPALAGDLLSFRCGQAAALLNAQSHHPVYSLRLYKAFALQTVSSPAAHIDQKKYAGLKSRRIFNSKRRLAYRAGQRRPRQHGRPGRRPLPIKDYI
jgi:hypothetical protein